MRHAWVGLAVLVVVGCGSDDDGPVAAASGGGGGAPTQTNGGSPAQTNGGSPAQTSGGSTSAPTMGCDAAPAYPANGSVTFYTFAMGSTAVNCSFDILGQDPDTVAHVATGNGTYFGAMNTADYANAATCGACVEVTRDGTRKVVVTIVDQCPTDGNPVCTAGHIDLSKQAFLQIGDEEEGYLGTGNHAPKGVIGWRYVSCPEAGPITFRLKEPDNPYWNQVLIEGATNRVAKVEAQVDGSWVAGDRQSYNYWQFGDGHLGTPPYAIRVTDVFGSQTTASLALTAGDQGSAANFPACE